MKGAFFAWFISSKKVLDVEIVELKASILHEENATKQPTKDTICFQEWPTSSVIWWLVKSF